MKVCEMVKVVVKTFVVKDGEMNNTISFVKEMEGTGCT